jgi:hypothetical protein
MQVDDRRAGWATKHTTFQVLTNRVSPTRMCIHGEILKTNIAKVSPAMWSVVNLPLRSFSPSSAIPSAFLGTGVNEGLERSNRDAQIDMTAIEKSSRPRCSRSPRVVEREDGRMGEQTRT